MTASRARSLLAKLALAAASLAVTLAVIEGVARLIVRARVSRLLTTRGSIVRYHPTLGWDKPPGASGWLRRPEYKVLLEINSHGLRGPDYGYPKPQGSFRTLLLGDSYAEGYTVPEDKTVRAVLERELNGRGCGRHEILNGGTIGYSTDQEYLFYLYEGHRYRPDVVVVLFCWNDLYFNTTGEQGKPYFDLEGERLVLRNSPVPPPREGPWLRTPEDRQPRIEPWRGSMALRLLSDRTADGNPRLHRFLARLGLVEPVEREEPTPDLWPTLSGHRQEVDEMWRRTAAILKAFKSDVESRGARLVLFYIPERSEVNDRVFELTLEKYRHARKGWRRDKVASRMIETCRALGIPLVDPREAFREADARGAGAYFAKDGHWNAVGHETAARELARFMEEGGLLPCPPGRKQPR